MGRHALLLVVGTAALFVFPAAATAQIVKIVQTIPKGGTDTDVGSTRIVVTGSGENKYDKVVTSSLDAWVSVSAPDKPPRDQKKLGGKVMVEGATVLNVAGGFPGSPTTYKLSFPYRDPRSYQVANQRVSPIELCNDKLASLSGAARENFRNDGGTILRTDAYVATADQAWVVRKQGSLFDEIKGWQDTAGINAVVVCHRLTGPKPRDTTTTTGGGGKPPTTTPKPQPEPTRVVPPPTIAKVTLRGEPMNWQNVGGQSCPTQMRLYGFVETNRAFTGKAIFFGPGFLNPPRDLALPGQGSRTLTATRDVKWPAGAVGGLAVAGGAKAAPKSQQVTVRFNVADTDGKVLESAQTTETLTCRTAAAPTRVRN